MFLDSVLDRQFNWSRSLNGNGVVLIGPISRICSLALKVLDTALPDRPPVNRKRSKLSQSLSIRLTWRWPLSPLWPWFNSLHQAIFFSSSLSTNKINFLTSLLVFISTRNLSKSAPHWTLNGLLNFPRSATIHWISLEYHVSKRWPIVCFFNEWASLQSFQLQNPSLWCTRRDECYHFFFVHPQWEGNLQLLQILNVENI